MATVLVSVRLSPEMAAALDHATGHLECSPGGLMAALLRRATARREAILKVPVPGPFTVKRNLRLAPQDMKQLTQLAGNACEPSAFLRRLFAHFQASPDWARLAGPADPIPEGKDGEATRAPRPVAVPRGHPLVVLLILAMFLLPLLVTGVEVLVQWARRRRAAASLTPEASPTSPRDGHAEPPEVPSA